MHADGLPNALHSQLPHHRAVAVAQHLHKGAQRLILQEQAFSSFQFVQCSLQLQLFRYGLEYSQEYSASGTRMHG